MEYRTPLFFLLLVALCLLFVSPRLVFAQSEYVLPYPSSMPGSLFYRINLLQEAIDAYWYYGDLGQYTYNMQLGDKYLVEAKTLFEYKQYLLAMQALKKSDAYFLKAGPHLIAAGEHGKDVSNKSAVYLTAAAKHKEILVSLLDNVPETFNWSPENTSATELALHDAIRESIKYRDIVL